MSELLSERSRSARKNESVNGGMSVDAVVVSCVDATVDGEGVSLSYIWRVCILSVWNCLYMEWEHLVFPFLFFGGLP